MFVAGGIDDQPAARFLAMRQAGSYWEFCQRVNAKGFDFSTMSTPDMKLHKQYKTVMEDVDLTDPED